MKRVVIAVVAIAFAVVVGTLVLLYDYDTGGKFTHSILHMLVAIPQDVTDANNAFAVDFYRQVAASEEHAGRNFFFSPTSTYIAFSALYEVAKEDTAAQMEDVFGFKPDTQRRHDDMRLLFSLLDPDFETSKTKQDNYFTYVENLDFAGNSEGSTDMTSDEATIDDISDTFDIYSMADYRNIYVEQDTSKNTDIGDFWTGTSNVEVNFMGLGGRTTFNHTHSDEVQVLQLPYWFFSSSFSEITFPYLDRQDMLYLRYNPDRLSMLIILPDDRDGIKELEDSLSADLVRKWQNSMEETEILPSIPRFRIDTDYDMQELLEAMGMSDIFDEGAANLSGIADTSTVPENIYISKLTYESNIGVIETHIEVINVNSATSAQTGADQSIPRFVADHPFVFVIQDDHSGTILFMGKVTDPTMK